MAIVILYRQRVATGVRYRWRERQPPWGSYQLTRTNMIKVRKISHYTGKGISPWRSFESKEAAAKYVEANQSYSGSYYWLSKGKEETPTAEVTG